MLDVLAGVTENVNQYLPWFYGLCALIILLQLRTLLKAGQERSNTMFTVEKEVWAHRQRRAISRVVVILVIVAVVAGCNQYLLPNINLEQYASPTPTHTLPIPTLEQATLTPSATPTSTPESVATATIAPTQQPTVAVVATVTPVSVAPASCSDPNIQITGPGMDAQVSGAVSIIGTASGALFNFYKVEYAIGEDPQQWNVIGNTHSQAVVGGTLATLQTQGLPNGTAWIRLTVVDVTGNYPNPCQVRINIQN